MTLIEMCEEAVKEMNAFLFAAKEINNRIEQMEDSKNKEIRSIEERELEKIESYASYKPKIMAFIEIAKSHCCKFYEPNEEHPIDSTKLSRLAVQIDGKSQSDINAENLYTEAKGQLKCIERMEKQNERDASSAIRMIEEKYDRSISKYKNDKNLILRELERYIDSEETANMGMLLQFDKKFFCENTYLLDRKIDYLTIGSYDVPLYLPDYLANKLKNQIGDFYDSNRKTFIIPFWLDFRNGSSLTVDYDRDTEQVFLSGLQRLILNTLRENQDRIEYIRLFDPIRFTSSGLGVISHLIKSGNSIVRSVPSTIEGVAKTIESTVLGISTEGNAYNQEHKKRKILIFHDFPESYDSKMQAWIQQLCINADRYNMTIIISHNIDHKKGYMNEDIISFIKTFSTNISCRNGVFGIKDKEFGLCSFHWLLGPNELPVEVQEKYLNECIETDKTNSYERRIGFYNKPKGKGSRRLSKIPIGVDEKGDLQYVDFENDNFATYICGAARSGKSTLLHTLITSVIQDNHPDDIELWLIDFKMTEFSRYIEHIPPHVRYIILDESPELVYDILDRLTEILIKRQNIFKGKWFKLGDVPKNKYMPAILVIIDEFSVMSIILSDSVNSGNDNYILKLQTLLAKGAALGIHFIFSSQGFTTGTRGLNEFSKKQVQQRIAMKTDYYEIKETLDLRSASDNDRLMMEQLPIHYALLRVPVNDKGNHLLQIKVLFIDDYTEQEKMIDRINSQYRPARKYDVNDASGYIYKQPIVVEGDRFISIYEKKDAISSYLENTNMNSDVIALFVGEPRKMQDLYAVNVRLDFYENIFIHSPAYDLDPSISVLLSILYSLSIQGIECEVWSATHNRYTDMIRNNGFTNRFSFGLDSVCQSISRIKNRIDEGTNTNTFVVIIEIEDLVRGMNFKLDLTDKGAGLTNIEVEPRGKDEPDINTMLDLLSGKGITSSIYEVNEQEKIEKRKSDIEKSNVQNARKDIDYILTYGPKQHYHFIVVSGSVGGFLGTRIDSNLFKHKFLFRMSKADASNMVGGTMGSGITRLDGHSFRYVSGIETLSFRPYLHKGLSWDGWNVVDNKADNSIDDEVYLL